MLEIDNNPFHILDRITDGFCALDRQWNIVYMNDQAARFFSDSRERLLHQCLWERFAPADHVHIYNELHRAALEQTSAKFEAYYRQLNIWLEIRAYPSMEGMSLFLTDVTESKQQSFRKERYYQSLFEHHPDSVYSMDFNGNYVSVNAVMQATFGYTEEELLKSSFIALVAEDELDKAQTYFQLAVSGIPQKYEMKARHKDGRPIYVNVTNIPIIVEDVIIGVYGIAKDITEQKQLIETMRKTEELYRLTSENSQDIITYTFRDGKLDYVSPAVKSLLGYESEELVGRPVYEKWHPADFAAIASDINHKQANESLFTCRVQHKEGHYIWFETTAKAIRTEQGGIDRILGISRNITERKKAEEELRIAKERLESFLHHNADAMWVIDLEETVREANNAFETMFQWKSQEIVGKPLPIVPDFLKSSIQKLHDQVKAGQAFVNFETLRQRKDGTLVCVNATISPLRNAEGRIIGLAGVCRDITEKKRSEQQLERTQKQLESFIDNHVDAVIIFNKEETVVRINDAFHTIFGWDAEEVVGKKVWEVLHISDDRKGEVVSYIHSLFTDGPFKGKETKGLRKDGMLVDISVSAFPITAGKDEHDGWAVVLQDITDRKEADDLLRKAEKLNMAGQFAAGIAHEIRNPITAIKGFVQLMRSGVLEKEMYFDIMASEIARIELILSELLILAKPQVNKFERSHIGTILGQVVALLDTQAIMNNVQIITECRATNLDMMCDKNQLKQAFINYIKNAIEAMPDGGEIKVLLINEAEDTLLLRIVDQGCGIPKHILEQLGQPFYTTKEKGTGLGFMVSKRIIDNHNGKINVISEENKGTTVELRFSVLPCS